MAEERALAGKIILETDRLRLREMTRGDFCALCEILRDSRVMYAYEGAFEEAEVRDWLEKQLNNYRCRGFGLWAVILKASSTMIGQCGLTLQEWATTEVLEVGYLFNKAYWRQGYATEAAVACREYAFGRLRAKEVFSIIRDGNTASQNVALRNGMTLRGEFVKHYRGVVMPHLVYSVKNPKNEE